MFSISNLQYIIYIYIYEYLLVYKSSVFTVYMWRVFTIFELNTSISIHAIDVALNRLVETITFRMKYIKKKKIKSSPTNSMKFRVFLFSLNYFLLIFFKTVINLYLPFLNPGFSAPSLHSVKCSI